MKWCWRLAIAVAMFGALALAQSSRNGREVPPHCNPDLIDPSHFVEKPDYASYPALGPYHEIVKQRVRKNWDSFIPREARFPELKTACVAIEFYISLEGNVERMKIGYTSGDEELDQAAWQAIKISSPFEPLPAETLAPLRVRFNFVYNPEAYKVSPRLIDSLDTLIASQAQALKNGPPPWRGAGPVPAVQTQVLPLGGQVPLATYSPLPSSVLPADVSPASGEVLLSLVVTKKGTVRHVEVTQSLSHELDENARKAIATWKFQPVYRYGEPIDMPVGVKVTYNLK